MPREFTYRNGFIFFIALWFGVLGLLFSLIALNAARNGQPLPVRHDGMMITSGPMVWMPVFMPALAVPIGGWLFLFAWNSKVVLDDDGVRIYNWARKQIFSAPWADITGAHRSYESRGGYCLVIQTKERQERITRSLIGIDDLERAIAERVGHSDPPTSELGLPLAGRH